MPAPAKQTTPSPTDHDVERLIAEHDAERPARRLTGPVAVLVTVVAAGLAGFALYWVFDPLPVLPYRMAFLAVVLPLTFLCYRPRRRSPSGRDTPGWSDWLLAALSVVVCAYPLPQFDEFIRRTVAPSTLDLVMAFGCLVLVLEATRRTIGPILPAFCLLFIGYAYYGGYLPLDWTLGHRGYDFDRILVQLYMGTEGLFGVPLDVAATYIVLFAIYGAVLDFSGAGKFFIDLSFAAFRRSAAAPGRTVTLAGFLLGTVSGSGTATTVSLGSVAWPILRRAGYPAEQGGGMLAAAGIGAILSPPTLGAAAFIIAEYLGVSYLRVLLFATVPTLLYYLGIVLAIEADARRFGAHSVSYDAARPGWLLLRYGYHFSSLIAIVVLMAMGLSPFRAVVYATILALVLSLVDREHRLTPRRMVEALASGATGVLPVAATTAAAGVIVGVVTLTGLGLKASSVIVDTGAGLLPLTAALAAIAVLVLGLAVPVTASFIIGAVIIGPALLTLGVSPEATYMFIFYYAVLSEVTPPTALAAYAASAITRGNPFRTMLETWKYTLPAFLVPFAFVLGPSGEALLGLASIDRVLLATVISALAVSALAVATTGWLVDAASWPERLLAAVASVLLLYLEPTTVITGVAVFAVVVAAHVVRRAVSRRHAPATTTSEGTSKDADQSTTDNLDAAHTDDDTVADNTAADNTVADNTVADDTTAGHTTADTAADHTTADSPADGTGGSFADSPEDSSVPPATKETP